MPKISIRSAPSTYYNPNAAPPERRSLKEIYGHDQGATKRGSTYFGKLMTCPFEFALYTEAKLLPVAESEALTTGLLYHMGLETYYDSIAAHQSSFSPMERRNALKTRAGREKFFWGASKQAQQHAYAAIERLKDEPGYSETYSKLDRMLSFYFETYWKNDEWEVLATEYPVEVNEGKINHYTTRLDLIVQDHKLNGVWVVENKSARAITDDLVSNYNQDFQILGELYVFMNGISFDFPFLGICVDIVSKALQPKATRVEVLPGKRHVAEFEKTLLAYSKLRAVYEELLWPKALGHCAGAKRGYSKCSYYDICHNFPWLTIEDLKSGEPPLGFVRVESVPDLGEY